MTTEAVVFVCTTIAMCTRIWFAIIGLVTLLAGPFWMTVTCYTRGIDIYGTVTVVTWIGTA